MEPLFVASKTDVTTMEFFPLKLYPNALWFVKKLNGVKTQEGAIPKSAIEKRDRSKLVEFFTHHTNYDDRVEEEKSLALNATFWPILKSTLFKVDDHNHDKFYDNLEISLEKAEDSDYLLIHRSSWDHQVWGIDGKLIMVPLRLEIWGSQYHLKRLGEHLLKSSHFSEFEIKPNTCWQNHDISGRSLGYVTFDPNGFKFPKKSSMSVGWCEDNFFRMAYHEDSKYDPFGVAQFVTEEYNKRY